MMKAPGRRSRTVTIVLTVGDPAEIDEATPTGAAAAARYPEAGTPAAGGGFAAQGSPRCGPGRLRS
jgi:hypothetical protein